MTVLMLRTDKPEAELYVYQDGDVAAQDSWQAHRELSDSLHLRIKQLLDSRQLTWHDLQAIAVYRGPGSFTGLRIGLSAANALAAALAIPVVAATGDDWQQQALDLIRSGANQLPAIPEYGALPHVTAAKK